MNLLPPQAWPGLLSKTARLAIVPFAIGVGACGGGAGDTSVAPPVATSIAPNSSTSLTAMAGDGVAELPSVIVKDQRGAAMVGVPVAFLLASGGGTIRGKPLTTNASGVATLGGWSLGTVPGSNSVTVSASGLAPVMFVAIGTASNVASVLLPTLGGSFSVAYAINDGGVVVGYSTDNSDATPFAVRWTPTSSGSWSITPIAAADSWALRINVNGTAVGMRAGRVKLWPATGGELDLGTGEPNGINGAETVVGIRRNPNDPGEQHALVWRKPSTGWDPLATHAPQDLPLFPGGTGWTSAKAINDAGIIAGTVGVSTGTSTYYAVRWDPVGDLWAQPIALPGTGGFDVTAARAINDKPQADLAGGARKCFSCLSFGMAWLGGSAGTSLESSWGGGGPGFVDGINNAQRVVGTRDAATSSEQHAFVWWPGRTSVHVLAHPGYTYTWAYDINNLSPAQAVGYGLDANGTRAIVWTIP